MDDDFDCCFPELKVGEAEALGSGGLPAPFIIAVAIVERGFLNVSHRGKRDLERAESCRYAQERLPIAAHKSDSGLPALCLRKSPPEGK